MTQELPIDVVLAVRNGESYLGAAIASVLSQSHQNLRLFVVDDNSEDDSRAIAEAARARDHRVALLRSEGSGIVAALETGIAAGTAPLVARMDADDVSLPRRFEMQSTYLGRHPEIALVGGAMDVIDGEGRVFRRMTYPTYPAEIERRILTEVCFGSSTMLLRRSAIEEIGGFRQIFEPAEDVDLALRIAEQHPVANLDEVVLCYRVHSSNISALRLARQMQAVMVARSDSAWRRQTGRESRHGLTLDELQRVLELSQERIDRQSFEAALAWSELLAEAELPDASEELLEDAASFVGDGATKHADLVRVQATRARARSKRAAGSFGASRWSNERTTKLPRAAVSGWERHGRTIRWRAVRSVYLARKGSSVLALEGPNVFAERVVAWTRSRRSSAPPPPEVILVDTSSEDALDARAPGDGSYREPDVSVVIVVWNALAYAEDCLESVLRAASERTLEVIVVDNGSEPDVLAWLKRQAELHAELGYIRLPSNVGFARGSNAGVRLSRGRYIVLLNSDTLVTDGWSDRLVEALERHEDLGVVSPVTNYVGEGDQIDEAARALEPEEAAAYARSVARRTGVIRVPERIAFFCAGMRRELFDRLNGLDEGFGLGNFEDEDFCLRTQMLGHRIGVVTNVFVFHHGSKTFEENRVDHSEWMIRNLDRYTRKIERSCTRFPALRARDRGTREPVVSVVTRTRNRRADLEIALNSLAWQTFREFEVVVVNDGGDDVEELVGRYAGDLQVQYLVNESGHGPARAANDGVEAARGRYVTYLDDDDIVYPFHLASLVRAAERLDPDTAFVYSHYNRALVRGRGQTACVVDRLHMPVWRFDRDDLLIQNRPPLHTWLHASALFERYGGFDPSLSILKDWDFLLRVTRDVPLESVPRETCEYRIYLDLDNSVTGGRAQALEELRNVYERHVSSSADIEWGRALELAGVENQVAMAGELQASLDNGGVTHEEAARRYVAEVFGFVPRR